MKRTGTISLAALCALAACGSGTFEVTASGTHVTVSPAGVVTVHAQDTQSFTVAPDAGYTTVSAVTGSCPAGAWAGNVYTTGKIVANCSVAFSATRETFTVSSSGSDVTVSPRGAQTVAAGATQAFTVTANTGDTTSSTVGGTCPAGSWSSSVYTTGAITADCTVTFSATVNSYLVSTSGDSFETISPSTPQTVSYGATQAFTVTPDNEYVVSSSVGGTCPAGTWSGSVYTTGTVTADCTVTFSAALVTYQVTASGDSEETFSPSTPQTVGYGLTQAFTVIGNHDWEVSATVAGSCPAGTWSGAVYTTGAIASDCSVSFSATPVVVVTTSTDANVGISPSGSVPIAPGSTESFTVTPAIGAAASYVPGGTCPAGSWSGAVYTTGAIAADCSIAFTEVTPVFQAATWTTSVLAGMPGTMSVANVTGATDTAQITLNQPEGTKASATAIGTATTDEIVRFQWTLSSFEEIGWGNVEAFSDGPEGQTVVALMSNQEAKYDVGPLSGTISLTLHAGYAFGFNVHSYEEWFVGTLTVSAIEGAPDVLVTASSDSYETVSPAGAVVRDGTMPTFTVIPNAGDMVSSVGGSCVAGAWNGAEYTTGSVTADCTLSFAGAPGTGGIDTGIVADAGGTRENTLATDVTLWENYCTPGTEGCDTGSGDADAGDGGAGDGGDADAGVSDAGVVPSIRLDTDPPFYTALNWTSVLWPGQTGGALANLSILNTDETLAFDSPPALDPTTGDLTFATTPGTYGTVTVLATPAGGAADAGLGAATFTITVNTPPVAFDVPVLFPWQSPCAAFEISAVDPDSFDWLYVTIAAPPQNGFITGIGGGGVSLPGSAVVGPSLAEPVGTGPAIPGTAFGESMSDVQETPGVYKQALCYIPFDSDFTGADSFTYYVQDDHGGTSNTATVAIQIFQPSSLP